jgi:hypothetical protein
MCIASAAAVASSRSDAFAISSPLEPGEIAHHRLEIEERLEPALGELRLVGCVLRIPARVLEDISQDDRGRDAVGVPHPDVAPPKLVLRRDEMELMEELVLRLGGR